MTINKDNDEIPLPQELPNSAPSIPEAIAELNLPAELPDKWLTKIKETVVQNNRQTVLITITGSSVLAAVLATAGNFWLEPYKARLNYQGEVSKARLQNQQNELNARRAAYDALDGKLEEFSRALTTYIGTCNFIARNPGTRGYETFAAQSWDLLTDQLGNVSKAEASSNKLNNDQNETGEEVEAITGSVAVNLFSPEVVKHKYANSELVNKHDELQQAIATAREHINQKKAALTLQPER
jgi:hypothetical protein